MNAEKKSVQSKITPFLKWAGGKRWLSRNIAELLRNPKGNYIEPFLGGGSVFFQMECGAALLCDINQELINAFRVVRDQPNELIKLLACLEIRKSLFKTIRKEQCFNPVARAARLFYLNRTAFNGLYRVNRKGDFNVPFGCKSGTQLVDADVVRACSQSLEKAVLMFGDFRTTLAFAGPNDSVFMDPPYTVKHDNNGFRHYNERIFSWDDQVWLAQIANRLAKLGTRIVITNAFHPEVIALYARKFFRPYVATRQTTIAADKSSRGYCKELVLLSESVSETNFHETHFKSPTVSLRQVKL